MTTILFDDRNSEVASAAARGDALWLAQSDLEAATGWHLEGRGMCRGDQCIPVPTGASWTDGNDFNLSAFAAHRGQGAASDGTIWSFGPPTESPLRDAIAPDFELPDFSGKMHSLSQYRGKKVLLMTWASW